MKYLVFLEEQGSTSTGYASLSDDPAGYPRAFVVKRLITFVGIVIGCALGRRFMKAGLISAA